jgi:hypothetical protein
MSRAQYFLKPNFAEYVGLLYELTVAIKEGRDETAEGDALRERMDEAGSGLCGDEIACIHAIAAEFSSLMGEPPGAVRQLEQSAD